MYNTWDRGCCILSSRKVSVLSEWFGLVAVLVEHQVLATDEKGAFMWEYTFLAWLLAGYFSGVVIGEEFA